MNRVLWMAEMNLSNADIPDILVEEEAAARRLCGYYTITSVEVLSVMYGEMDLTERSRNSMMALLTTNNVGNLVILKPIEGSHACSLCSNKVHITRHFDDNQIVENHFHLHRITCPDTGAQMENKEETIIIYYLDSNGDMAMISLERKMVLVGGRQLLFDKAIKMKLMPAI
jgi:hypothetical protein